MSALHREGSLSNGKLTQEVVELVCANYYRGS